MLAVLLVQGNRRTTYSPDVVQVNCGGLCSLHLLSTQGRSLHNIEKGILASLTKKQQIVSEVVAFYYAFILRLAYGFTFQGQVIYNSPVKDKLPTLEFSQDIRAESSSSFMESIMITSINPSVLIFISETIIQVQHPQQPTEVFVQC